VEVLDPGLVVDQIRAVVSDIPPAAAKTGALGGAGVIEAVAREAASFTFPLVVDPVMVSKHGTRLVADEARAALLELLLPRATLLTPNLHEAEALTGMTVDSPTAMRQAGERLLAVGCGAVVIKGGHLAGAARDVLVCHDGSYHEFMSERIDTPHTHGTGCTYSAAITAALATGLSVQEAVAGAKHFIERAIRTNPGLGGGCGPVNHFA
jgi:hydroxymethylpyrimidine/phosphomethylpyrimidine kinase